MAVIFVVMTDACCQRVNPGLKLPSDAMDTCWNSLICTSDWVICSAGWQVMQPIYSSASPGSRMQAGARHVCYAGLPQNYVPSHGAIVPAELGGVHLRKQTAPLQKDERALARNAIQHG